MDDLATLYQEIQQLKIDNELLRATRATNATTTPASATTSSNLPKYAVKKRLPDPPLYNGEFSSFHPWMATLENKIIMDGHLIGDESDQVRYCFSRLEGKAAKHMFPWQKKYRDTAQFTVQSFSDKMNRAFADPQSIDKALRKLRVLKQGEKTFGKYLQEFEQLILEAGGDEWEDAVKRNYLDEGLNEVMATTLAGQYNLPQGFDEYCRALSVIGDKVAALKQYKILATNKNAKPAGQTFITAAPGAPPPPSAPKAPPPTSPETMDWIKTNAVRATWVGQKEIDARKKSGACLRCGTRGHLIKACKFLPAVKPVSVNDAMVEHMLADEEDEENGEELKE
jgi:hypothetical protein